VEGMDVAGLLSIISLVYEVLC